MEKTFTALITETNAEGNGVVKIDGCVVFVIGAVRGDRVTAEIYEEKKNYKLARIVSFEEKSPERTECDCEAFPRCGGCTLRHVSYSHELEIKKNNINAALRREGLGEYSVGEILHASPERYRNKAVIRFTENGFGFCAEGTNEVASVRDCKIIPAVFAEIGDYVYCECRDCLPEYLFLRKNYDGSEIVALIGTKNADKYSDLANKLCEKFPTVGVVACDGDVPEEGKKTLICGRDYINEKFLGLDITVSAESFFQVNHDAAETLCRKVSEYVSDDGAYGADLYCGTGIIGMSIAALCPSSFITGVEINESAVADAKKNAERNGLKNVGFFCGDSADFAKNIYGTLDFVIIDPPRRGCGEKMIKELLRIKSDRIIYVSCGPTTLARDLKLLCEKQYEIKEVTAVDLFPRTKHVETVVLLTRVKD